MVLSIGSHVMTSASIIIHALGRVGIQNVGQRYYTNKEGYQDVTAEMAMELVQISNRKSVGKEKYDAVMKDIFAVCEKHGYRVVGRIILEDKYTGRIWR